MTVRFNGLSPVMCVVGSMACYETYNAIQSWARPTLVSALWPCDALVSAPLCQDVWSSKIRQDKITDNPKCRNHVMVNEETDKSVRANRVMLG